MELVYLGHASFLLRHKNVRLVTDPFGEAVGFAQAKVEAEVVTISHSHFDHNDLSRVEGNPVVFRGPGEYEVKGLSLTGLASWHDDQAGKERGSNTIFLIDIDEMRLAHLGDLGHNLTEQQLEAMDGVEVLLVPVGGTFTLGPAEAAALVRKISPSIVVPMHYKTKRHSQKFAQLLGVEEFISQMQLQPQYEKKLSLTKSELPEETKLYILEER